MCITTQDLTVKRLPLVATWVDAKLDRMKLFFTDIMQLLIGHIEHIDINENSLAAKRVCCRLRCFWNAVNIPRFKKHRISSSRNKSPLRRPLCLVSLPAVGVTGNLLLICVANILDRCVDRLPLLHDWD